MMNRFVLIVLYISFFMTGCAVSDKGGKIEITYQTIEVLPEQRKALQELVKEFEKLYPDIRVKVLTSSTSFQKLNMQIAGGNVPDVFYYTADRLPILVEKGVVKDLTPFIKADPGLDMDVYYKKIVEECKVHGRLYLFPFHFSTDIVFYNKELFRKAGIKYPGAGWTWEDFLRIAKELTINKSGRIVQYGTFLPRPLMVIQSFGGRCFNDNFSRCTINSKSAHIALKFLLNMIYKHQVAPNIVAVKDMDKMDGIDLFRMGKVAMLPGRTFMYAELRKWKDLEWDIAPVPRGLIRYSRLAIGGNCISAQTKHPEAAWKFVKFFSGKKGSVICGTSGNCVPAYREIAESEYFLHIPPENNKLFVESLAYSKSDNPGVVFWHEFYDRVLQKEIEKILCKIVSIEEGLKEIEKEGNKLLRLYGYVKEE